MFFLLASLNVLVHNAQHLGRLSSVGHEKGVKKEII